MERLARMLHAGQQSAFPKVRFITNRMKLETVIRQGLERTMATSAPPVDRAQESEAEYMSTINEVDFGPVGADDGSGGKNLSLSTPQRPRFRKRRSSVIEEMRRQSAVFFDDTDVEGDGYGDTTGSEDGSVIAGEAGGTRIG